MCSPRKPETNSRNTVVVHESLPSFMPCVGRITSRSIIGPCHAPRGGDGLCHARSGGDGPCHARRMGG
eukprot:1466227-Pleurochrysis_carterae.AAC.1